MDSWRYAKKWGNIKRKIRVLLRYIFGLRDWHDTPLNDKPYAVWTVRKINEMYSKQYSTVVEVGCGLGDIVGNTDFSRKFGYDISEESIRVAKIIHPSVCYKLGSFPDVKLGRIDVLVMVNFTVSIDGTDLNQQIKQLMKNNSIKIFVVDTFIKSDEEYQFVHDWQQIFGEEYFMALRSRGFATGSNKNRRYIEFWER